MDSNTDNTFDTTAEATDAAATSDRAQQRPRSLRFWIRAITRMTPGRAERHAFRTLLKNAEVVSPEELAAATATLEKLARAAGWTDDMHVPRGERERGGHGRGHGRGQRECGQRERGRHEHGHREHRGHGRDHHGHGDRDHRGFSEHGVHGTHRHGAPEHHHGAHGCRHGERGGFHPRRDHKRRDHKHRLVQYAFERGFAAGFHRAH